MKDFPCKPQARAINSGRRRFVMGLAAGGVGAALGLWRSPVLAAPNPIAPPVLYGPEFDLSIADLPVNYTGRARVATAVNGTVPAPLLRWREGDRVTLRVTNRMPADTSIHWHGILVPTGMDGVPGLSFPGIAPGETFVYAFDVRQSGTYWYHSHTRFQEQTGLYGPIVIDPKDGDPIRADRDYVVMLSDWTDEDPERLFSKLKFQSDYYNFHRRTVGDFLHDVRHDGWRKAFAERRPWNQMRMSPNDILDVTGHTYTYLTNGVTPAGNWTGLFKPGERVRLRFINGSSMTYFDVRIPGLKMTVVQADGQDVEPVPVDEFRIAVAETYDVLVEPTQEAHTIFAQSMDRSGYARGTLATRAGLAAAIPPLDPRPVRTMVDMGMGGMNMDQGGMAGMPGMDGGDGGKANTESEPQSMPGMDMSTRSGTPSTDPHARRDRPDQDHAAHGGMGMDMKGMQMDKKQDMPGMDMGASANAKTKGASEMPPQPPGEYPQNVDNRAMAPSERLNDPGLGLENNGRRVLTYADLIARTPNRDPREPMRELTIHLTGNMMRFIWSFDGRKFSQAEPIRLKYNERVRLTLINDTMMEHPIHLHGMFGELENGHGAHRPRKHTINVKGGEKLSYLVTADALGRWAYHCHLLYHMEAGMFREVTVA